MKERYVREKLRAKEKINKSIGLLIKKQEKENITNFFVTFAVKSISIM